MAFDAVLKWQKGSPDTTAYQVQWTLNGVNSGAVQSIPQSSAGDTAGYATDFATANPGVTLNGNDVVDATIKGFDANDNLSSTPVTPPAVTVPPTPPSPPTNVTLELTGP
jgi:hypothetical protein